jgi:hypothetical protein
MAAKKKQDNTVFVISYAPLLKAEKPFLDGEDNVKAIIDRIYEVDSNVKGCVWSLEEDGTPCANFVIPRGKEIAAHLVEWAEGKPEDKFKFAHLEKDGTYVLSLMPDVEQSIKRVQANHEAVYGKKIAKNKKYQVLFNPLSFLSQTKSAYDSIREHLKDKAYVSLIEFTDDMPNKTTEELKTICMANRVMLGKFSMETLDMSQQFLTQVIDSKN